MAGMIIDRRCSVSGTYPEAGNIRHLTANSKMKRMPSQNAGIEIPNKAIHRAK